MCNFAACKTKCSSATHYFIWDNYKKNTSFIVSRRSSWRLTFILISVPLKANKVRKWRWVAIKF